MSLRCWFCDRALDPVDILAEGTIEPRATAKGGPIYHYRCPGCRRRSVCERNARGRVLARPRRVVPIVDRLQALFDADLAREHAARGAWWARHPGIVSWFHEELVAAIDSGLDAESVAAAEAREAAAREARLRGEPPPPPPPAGPPPPDGADPFAVLGLAPGADRDEIVRAFRRLAKEHHPDRFAVHGRAAEEAARRRFVRILDAYERLRGAG